MRLLADMHIAPRTVALLRSLGHDVRRVNELLPPTAADAAIVAAAIRDGRSILTQDLDFSAMVVLSGKHRPVGDLAAAVVVSGRAGERGAGGVLPGLEPDLREGAIVTVEDRPAALVPNRCQTNATSSRGCSTVGWGSAPPGRPLNQ